MARARQRLEAQTKLLHTLGYENVLARGFALVRDAKGGMVRSAASVQLGEALDIQFSDGHIDAQATATSKDVGTAVAKPKVARSKSPRIAKPKPDPDGDQGSLL
jgi:exodeoxyribonuclease VII large subunit